MSKKADKIFKDFDFVKKKYGISEYVLKKNSLKVLLAPIENTEVTAVQVTYLAGSRHEKTGETGSAHLLEHMLFKGSPKFNKKDGTDMDRFSERIGAMQNASTWKDRTNYYEIVRADYVEKMLEYEADRMQNAFINDKDLETEMPVVKSEFEIGRNDPVRSIYEDLWATAYMASGYHHSTIGWLSDIESINAEKLKNFYKKHYRPDNAVLTIAGAFDELEILRHVKKYFSGIKNPAGLISSEYSVEPEQFGERLVSIEKDSGLNILIVAHKSPRALDKDTVALTVLDEILMGGENSRLQDALVDKNIATDIESLYYPFFNEGLFITSATLSSGIKHDDVKKIILDVYDDIKNNGVTKRELEGALSRLSLQLAKLTDGPDEMMNSLNDGIAVGDWEFRFKLSKSIKKIKRKDVQGIAKKYLRKKDMTVGMFKSKKIS